MSQARTDSESGLWRVPPLVFSLALLAAALWPALRDPPRDSFPLSNFPMFSSVRDKPWIHVVVGFDAAGEEHKIPPTMVANIEVMQAAQTIRIAVKRKQTKQLCRQVAERVRDEPKLDHIVRLEVQSRQFDPRTYFVTEAGREPLKLRRRARCQIDEAREEPGT